MEMIDAAAGRTIHKKPRRKPRQKQLVPAEPIPFKERPTCSVDDAAMASSIGRSVLYQKMRSGELDYIKVGARRLIKVPSLLKLLGMTA